MGRGDDPPGVDPFDLAAARRMYWAFHWGAPPDRELPLLGPRDIPRVTAQLGELVDLRLRHGELVRVTGGRVHLLTDQHGRHLYLGAEAPIATAFEPGRIVSIAYRTNKGGARDTWEHHFEGARPFLDVSNGWPVIRRAGSAFRVTWRGIEG